MNTYTPPSDKSITIRALLFSAISGGTARIENPLICDDTEAALRCLTELGVKISRGRNAITVAGRGLRGLRKPAGPLNAGESGALSRMLAGILAGQYFPSVITGRGSLLKRPMAPLASELNKTGARVTTNGGRLPLAIQPSVLKGGKISGLDSAQLKSALLLAGLYAGGPLEIKEKLRTRDHTERMLAFMGVRIAASGPRIKLEPGPLTASDLVIPGDVSSAAFFISGALLSGRPLKVISCGLNPFRLGFIKALVKMGACISLKPAADLPEPCGAIEVLPSALFACRFGASEIPAMIDEIPMLAVTAARARGTTVISGIEALRAKESDRIKSTLALLTSLGVKAVYRSGGMTITGRPSFRAAVPVETFADHRIAMAAAAASLACPGLEIRDTDCVNKSYPDFWKDFKKTFGAVRLSSRNQ